MPVIRAVLASEGGTRPVQLREVPETMLLIEVGLAAPANPYPEISATTGVLEKSRESLEQEKMAKLEAAYNAALSGAKSKIAAVVGAQLVDGGSRVSTLRHGSFLALRGGRARGVEGASVKVRVSAGAPVDASVKSQLEGMEAKRDGAEAEMLDQAISEMSEATDVVVSELKKSLRQHSGAVGSSFLERAGHQVEAGAASAEGLGMPMNVRVGTSEVGYPTIGSLAQDMASRRDSMEGLERAKILELTLKLLEAENEMIKDALDGVVQA